MYSTPDYEFIKERLCLERTKEGMIKREKLFEKMDLNKNGLLSYSEVNKGIIDVLNLPEIYEKKEVIRKAFDTFKNSVNNSKDCSKDLIELNEFRYFLFFLDNILNLVRCSIG